MKQFDKWFFPDGEAHLPQWMQQVGNRQDGRLTYQYGKYESALGLCKKRRWAVDIGSHVGLWAYFMARDFEQIKCFEPMPEHAECWRKNMGGGILNATLFECALGENEGSVRIGTRTHGSSGDTGVLTGETMHSAGFDVPMQTLDYFHFPEVDLIKIDCEGYEEFVLRGAVDTLERCKPVVVVEQKGNMSAQYGLAQKSAVNFLEKMGAKMRQEISGDFIMSWD